MWDSVYSDRAQANQENGKLYCNISDASFPRRTKESPADKTIESKIPSRHVLRLGLENYTIYLGINQSLLFLDHLNIIELTVWLQGSPCCLYRMNYYHVSFCLFDLHLSLVVSTCRSPYHWLWVLWPYWGHFGLCCKSCPKSYLPTS